MNCSHDISTHICKMELPLTSDILNDGIVTSKRWWLNAYSCQPFDLQSGQGLWFSLSWCMESFRGTLKSWRKLLKSRSTECPDVSVDQGRQTHCEGNGMAATNYLIPPNSGVKSGRNSKKRGKRLLLNLAKLLKLVQKQKRGFYAPGVDTWQ